MKNTKLMTGAAMMIALAVGHAKAATINYVPDPINLYDLDHNYGYIWGINGGTLDGQVIESATLVIENIRDWQVTPDDNLYIRLVDNAAEGVTSEYDGDVPGDMFDGQGVALTTFSDLGPYNNDDLNAEVSTDLVYTFTGDQLATLSSYVADGNFGLTFDPDCHYYNKGFTLTLETRDSRTPPVPEPTTLGLVGLGFLGLALIRKRVF